MLIIMGTVVDGPIYVFTLVGVAHFSAVYRELLPGTNSDKNRPRMRNGLRVDIRLPPNFYWDRALSVFEEFGGEHGKFVCLFVCLFFSRVTPPHAFFLIFFS